MHQFLSSLELLISLCSNSECCELAIKINGSCTEKLHNYDRLLRVLANRFCPEDRTNHLWSELKGRVQCPGEDVTTYRHALKQMGPRTHHMFSVVEVEKAIIEQFVEGIAIDQMHCHLQLQKPSAMERCFILACNVKQCYRQESQWPMSTSQPPHGKGKSVSFQFGSAQEESNATSWSQALKP